MSNQNSDTTSQVPNGVPASSEKTGTGGDTGAKTKPPQPPPLPGTASAATEASGQNSKEPSATSATTPPANREEPKSVTVTATTSGTSYRSSWERKEGPLKPQHTSPRMEILKSKRQPMVLITPDAYMAMCLYVEIGPLEVGWQGCVRRTEDGDFLIEKTYLLEQEVTGTETDLSVDARFKLAFELSDKGDDGIDEANRIRFWGHSHVRMGTSPSGTDERTMDQFEREQIPWYVRGIFNKFGVGTFWLYFFDQGYKINDAEWAVIDPATEEILLQRNTYQSSSWSPSTWRFGSSGADDKADALTVDKDTLASEGSATFPGAKTVAEIRRKRDYPSWLPDKLIPSEQLRAAIQAEYNQKVIERHSLVSWLANYGDDQQQMEEPAGDGAPVISESKPAVSQSAAQTAAETGANTIRVSEPQSRYVGKMDLKGTWVPVSHNGKPVYIDQTHQYIRLQLHGRQPVLTGSFIADNFVVDAWSATRGTNYAIRIEMVNFQLIRLVANEREIAGVYKRYVPPPPQEKGPGFFATARQIWKEIVSSVSQPNSQTGSPSGSQASKANDSKTASQTGSSAGLKNGPTAGTSQNQTDSPRGSDSDESKESGPVSADGKPTNS